MFYGLASCIARLLAGPVCNLTRINPRYVFQVGSLIATVSVVLLPLPNCQTCFILCSVFLALEMININCNECFTFNLRESIEESLSLWPGELFEFFFRSFSTSFDW